MRWGLKSQDSLHNGITRANEKKGNQHMAKAPVIMARVLAAFLSFLDSASRRLCCLGRTLATLAAAATMLVMVLPPTGSAGCPLSVLLPLEVLSGEGCEGKRLKLVVSLVMAIGTRHRAAAVFALLPIFLLIRFRAAWYTFQYRTRMTKRGK